MDIKEAVEIVKEIATSIELSEKGIDAIKTLIDYCSEPKVRLEEGAVLEVVRNAEKGLVALGISENIAQSICNKFKLSVPSKLDISEALMSAYCVEGNTNKEVDAILIKTMTKLIHSLLERTGKEAN